MVIVQYPDSITVMIASPGTLGTDGNYSDPSIATYTYACRAETNVSGRKVIGIDGTMKDYAIICYMPRISLKVPTDSSYSLTKADGSIFSGAVKNASNGQLNTRIWL